MPAEFFLAVVVLAVVILVAADFFRTSSDSPHEHAGEPVLDAGRETFPEPRAVDTASLPKPRAVTAAFLPPSGGAGHAFDAGLLGQATRIGSPAGGQYLEGGAATSRRGSHGAQKSWLVRTRLSLLAMVPAIAAVLVTVGVIRAAGAFRSASLHSGVSDGAVASALVACIFSAAVLAVGVTSAVILIRSVLRPLRKLQAGAVELAEVRLPDALRRITGGGGHSAGDVEGIATSSSDEIGEVARAFDQIQGEVLRLAANEAGLRGKLNEMFVDLSCRSQSLVERQIRLIDELEQGEQDTERLANLFKMDHIATRMRRYSQNLLVLAGHELPGRWNEPVTLVNVIRAAVSEIEEYERVSVRTQPDIAVSGPAVNDVVHLIAELAENATSLSAADTPVDISGRPLASGGVLVEVTDEGVGMNPDVMAQANWRLDNPSATDITAYRKMGLFVVGRLAARHDIKVRLQPTSSGGLTALVWLPDAIVVRPAMASARQAMAPERPAMAPERPAGTGPDRVPAAPAVSARSLRPAPVAQDTRPVAQDTRATAQDTRATAQDTRVRQRPDIRPRPPAQDQAPAPGPQASPADERRLPIYEAVESDWFSRREQFGGTAAAEDGWEPRVDEGWRAAEAVIAPSSSGVTTAGLPVRMPRANLVPGAISGPQPTAPRSARSATAARDRLAGFQRGASEGRAAASAAPGPGDEGTTF
ncbi:MAG: ATP-binding protein [Streptosporangiaceae bacterium]